MKEVIAKPQGMVINCGRNASDGLRAKRAKSGSFCILVSTLVTSKNKDYETRVIPQLGDF